MDPQQKLFTALLMRLKAAGLDVYDGELPPEGTPYPFVYLADTVSDARIYKAGVTETVSLTVHVWHNDTLTRGLFSQTLLAVKQNLYGLQTDTNASLVSLNQQTIADDTTDTPLLHGIITAGFLIS